MEMKQAVEIAKTYVHALLEGEGVENLGFEEIEKDQTDDTWEVTLGFSRPWNTRKNAISALTGQPAVGRTFRVVKLRDSDGKILSIKKRDPDPD